jgi:adenine-specific DNA-methyltransferase
MTREPEMVRAYRDTWELGLHSYLTYLRDRLLLARDLLDSSGSVFVQISDENVHLVRAVIDEVFGARNFCSQIAFAKTAGQTNDLVSVVTDYLIWYAKDRDCIKFRRIFKRKSVEIGGTQGYDWGDFPDGTWRRLTSAEKRDVAKVIEQGTRIFKADNLTSAEFRPTTTVPYVFEGRTFHPGSSRHWRVLPALLDKLALEGRLIAVGNTLSYVQYANDFPFVELNNNWDDTSIAGYAADKFYVVQTNPKVIERCILMTTDPGDLVLDPTCGSGTTAYVAEQWGRRWITVDTSRVPLALARQRLLTAIFPYYQLKDEGRGPAGGFVYARRQNRKGEEVGGIVSHFTLGSIASGEPPKDEILVDRPEDEPKVTRVVGPFCVEATIPTPVGWDSGTDDASNEEEHGSFLDRMLDVLRLSPVLQLGSGKSVTLHNVRLPAKSLALSAEATVDVSAGGNPISLGDAVAAADERNRGGLPFSQRPVALVFGPENGAVSERLVFEAAREAHAKSYTHLYVIGFAIQPNARRLVEDCEEAIGVPATWVAATPDLTMGDLLKNMRSSQIFSVCGLPEVKLRKLAPTAGGALRYQVALLGLDVFDPVTMENDHRKGDDVPAWMLDTDYNGLVFHGCQVFFPRTGAWENLKKALKATHDESVWDHLAGTESAPFEAGEHGQIAVKVIDDRGNELLVVHSLAEAK